MNEETVLKHLKASFREVKYLIKNFIDRITCCWDYLVFAWTDGSWNEYSFYKLIKLKISRYRKVMSEYNLYSDSDKYCRQMYITELVLDRLIKDEYFRSDLHIKKWGESEWEFIPIPGTTYSSVNITHSNVKTEEDKEQERKDFMKLADQETMLREQDKAYLYKRLSKYLKNWSV